MLRLRLFQFGTEATWWIHKAQRASFSAIANERKLSLHFRASLPVIGALLGHSQATTTARYTHLANDPVRQAGEATAANIAAAMQNDSSAEVLSIRTRKG